MVNWDAAVDRHKMKMGIGVIIRDSMDEVLTPLSEPKNYIIALDVTCNTSDFLKLINWPNNIFFIII
jgi:hypothetical protein